MPRFYFDLAVGDSIEADEDGIHLPDLEAARLQASAALCSIVRELLTRSLEQELAMTVRGEDGRPLTQTRLTLSCHELPG